MDTTHEDEHMSETTPAFASEPDEVLLAVAERARALGDVAIADALTAYVAERRARGN